MQGNNGSATHAIRVVGFGKPVTSVDGFCKNASLHIDIDDRRMVIPLLPFTSLDQLAGHVQEELEDVHGLDVSLVTQEVTRFMERFIATGGAKAILYPGEASSAQIDDGVYLVKGSSRTYIRYDEGWGHHV